MPTKAPPPVAPAYNWGGCYMGVNAGAGGAGSDFNSTVGNGTQVLPTDAALVSNSGTGSANSTGFIGGGQAGCNWQSGLIVYGLEGDFDYFRSNPQFINGTDTLSDGVTPFTVTQALTTDFFATVRPRIGVAADRNLALHHRRRRILACELHPKLCGRRDPAGQRQRNGLEIAFRLDRRRRLGIRLGG